MRCKRHPTDSSSGGGGVCASCLHERILKLIEEQSRANEGPVTAPEPQPPQRPAFPRSVSPYVSSQKSDNHRCRQFYSTPQVGSMFGAANSFSKQSKLWRFVNLFRFRSDKIDSEPSVSDLRMSPCRDSRQAQSSTWLSFLRRRRQKNQSQPCNRISNRGMSPESRAEAEDHWESGYSSESPPQRPKRTPVRAGQAKSRPGMALCLSPLVRASPSRQWNQKETGAAGEMRTPAKHCLSTMTSFPGNRSRKVADFGRVSYNR